MRALGIEVEHFTNHCPHTVNQYTITEYLYGNVDLPGETIDKILNQLGIRQVSLRWMRTASEKKHRSEIRNARRRQKNFNKQRKILQQLPQHSTFIPYSGDIKITSNL